MRPLILALGISALIIPGLFAQEPNPARTRLAQDAQQGVPPPLSRVREGGTPYDPNQPLRPYAIHRQAGIAPTSGVIASPPEYGPTRGVLYRYFSSQWPTVVVDCVARLTQPPEHDEIAYVMVTNAAQQNTATSQFIAAGADMSKVQFLIVPGDSVWARDYGPHFIWQDDALAIVDLWLKTGFDGGRHKRRINKIEK